MGKAQRFVSLAVHGLGHYNLLHNITIVGLCRNHIIFIIPKGTIVSNLTKRQHFVPQFYIRLWNNDKNQITSHDLIENTSFETSSENVLLKKWFYETDPDSPDNMIEKQLSEAEGVYSLIFNSISSMDLDAAQIKNRKKVIDDVKALLLADNSIDKLKDFCALQYVRIPGAIDQKAFELQSSTIPHEEKEQGLIPGYFVSSGYRYVVEKFRRMNAIALISGGQDYVTSDWPCFDLKDSSNAPVLGEEIGEDPDVVAYFPVTPRLALILYHRNYSNTIGSVRAPNLIVKISSNHEVKNCNSLVIQQADRFVITRKASPFVEKVASKRKKRKTA